MHNLIISIFALILISSPPPSIAKDKIKKNKLSLIPIIGKTDDRKYPIYDLTGNINDFKYMSQGRLFFPDELKEHLQYISLKDVNTEFYRCQWVCKDHTNQIVGLNPQYRNK